MKSRLKKGFLLLLCLSLLCGCAAVADDNAPELQTPVSLNPDSAFAEYNSVFDLSHYIGKIYANYEKAAFVRGGRIDQILVEYGQTVSEGDVLATLDSSSIEAQISSCQAEIASARNSASSETRKQQIQLELLQLQLSALQNSGASSYDVESKSLAIERQKLQMRRTAESQQRTMNSLNQKLSELQATLAEYTLTAPCDGTVIWFSAKAAPGYSVSADAAIFYVADLSDLYIQTNYVTAVTLDKMSHIYAIVGDREYDLAPAEVDEDDRISNMLSGNQLYTRFEFVDPIDSSAFGTFGVVCMTSNEKDNVLCVPSNAIFTDSVGTYVYRIENQQRVKTYVTIGVETVLRTEIIEGIQEGDEIYVQG